MSANECDQVSPGRPAVRIHYCDQCGWMLRAAWMAQELLTTFRGHIGSVTLQPGTGGVFEVRVDDFLIWSRARDGGFPEITLLKQRVRDIVAPDMPLGHADRKKPPDTRG